MELYEQINKLRDYLLSLPTGRYIGKIILFGSHAKGYATRDSDIDILLITINGKALREELLDSIYDFMTEEGIPIEVVFGNVNDIYFSKDPFISNVLRYGVEVYSMNESELKRSVIEGLLGLAEEYLKGAEEIANSGHLRIAIDAGYNAAELAVKALILLKQDDLPGSHGGIASLFGPALHKDC
ncbi:MAG: nucleotidyltransferase domain-containing protein [Thermodesulfovibrionales bacterium]|nr:nucleotidyltransferase domain-containing protein [Thermodesulfovibrionales bacterium]